MKQISEFEKCDEKKMYTVFDKNVLLYFFVENRHAVIKIITYILNIK
jgi:chemotaxis methyl-accepting protein methylase